MVKPCLLTTTFTTAALDRSSLWLFGASPCRATPRGLPSSFVQHEAHASSWHKQSRWLYGCWPLKGAFSQPSEAKARTKAKASYCCLHRRSTGNSRENILPEFSKFYCHPGRALLFTHNFSTDDNAQLDIDKANYTSPDGFVARKGISVSRQVAAQPC